MEMDGWRGDGCGRSGWYSLEEREDTERVVNMGGEESQGLRELEAVWMEGRKGRMGTERY